MAKKNRKTIFKKFPFGEKMGYFNEPLINKLYLLFGIFLFTITAVLVIENYFDKHHTFRYQEAIRNQEQKQRIEALLKENLLHINLDFKSYSTVTHPKQLENVQNGIRDRINRTIALVEKLDKGGSVTGDKAVNMEDLDHVREIIHYEKDEYTESIPEIRDIPAMLYELQSLSARIAGALEGNLDADSLPERSDMENVNFYQKQAESLFSRIYENENQISSQITKTISDL
ncbi:MAG: hybrid sensor histidine kinase/response regulator, partial [Marinilabiliaceae bacterium]